MAIATEKAKQIFRKRGGTLRTGEAIEAGIHPRTIYGLRDSGELETLARGVYRLAEMPPAEEMDLLTVAKRVPQGVVCLISALAWHELTTQIPHEIQLALPRTARQPKLDYPPLQVFRFSPAAFDAGIEEHSIDGARIRVYSAEKTIADCFRFRNRIGLDVVLESLREYRSRRDADLTKVLEFAKLCRVTEVIRPYLEAMV